MGKDIDIISYTNCSTQLRKNQEETHPACSKNLLRRRKNFESSDAGNTKEDDFIRADQRKVNYPYFIEKPLIHEMAIVKRRTNYLKQSLMRDLFMGHGFVYPFRGLVELLTHRVYWGPLLIFGGCYICVFTVVAIIYYILVIPIVIAWAMVTLGPLGVILGHIQWILQTNAITSIICRNIVLTHLGNQIFDITLYLNGQTEFLNRAKFIKYTKNDDGSFFKDIGGSWQIAIPLMIIHCLRKLTIITILTLLSLIPLLGPIVTNQLLSGRRAFSYMGRYFALKGGSSKENKDFQYQHLGIFFTFGMAAGLLEFVPLFSVITITSNTIGAAKWSIDLIKKNQNQ